MAFFRKLGRQRAGQVITARTLENLQDVGEFASRIRALPPLAIIATAAGPILRYAWPIFQAYIGVVQAGGITARSSTTLGTGSVKLQQITTAGVVSNNGMTVSAWNISSTVGGIASGKYVVVLKIAGLWIIITAEC